MAISDLSLAYRIMTMPSLTMARDGVLEREGIDQTDYESTRIPGCIKFDVSNVADYYYANNKHGKWSDIIPNMAPPFNELFMEFNAPVSKQTVGGYCCSNPLSDADKQSHIESILGRSSHFYKTDKDRACDRVLASYWLITISLWVSIGKKPHIGFPGRFPAQAYVYVGGDGKVLSVTKSFMFETISEIQESGASVALSDCITILGLAFSFCHCKNVSVIDRQDDRGRKWHKNTRTPILTYKQLQIEPMKKVLRTEGQSETQGLQKALHICRGHFATYSPEHPLFGKYVGTFWRPDHVRGKQENGEVVKSYKVNPLTDPLPS